MRNSPNTTSGEKVLIVAAHPDDEVLGCGGTIARHASVGDSVKILIVAEGLTSRQESRDREKALSGLASLRTSAELAASILGAAEIEILDLPDNRLDSVDRLDLTKLIEERIQSYRPSTVYSHHCGDVNIDHRRLHEAVVTACRPLPGHPVKHLLAFEVASSTEWQTPGSAPGFHPNWFVDITEHWDQKREALMAYESEMRPWPHARSVEGVEYQNRWRGVQVGVRVAEAFMSLRCLR